MAERKKQIKRKTTGKLKAAELGAAKSKTGLRRGRKPAKAKLALAEIAPTAEAAPAAEAAREADVEEVAEPSDPVDPNADGVEALRDSLNREVARKANKIARTFAEKAMQGNVSCTKLMLDLLEKKQPAKGESSKRLSRFIDLLESDPEWVKPEANDAECAEDNNA